MKTTKKEMLNSKIQKLEANLIESRKETLDLLEEKEVMAEIIDVLKDRLNDTDVMYKELLGTKDDIIEVLKNKLETLSHANSI